MKTNSHQTEQAESFGSFELISLRYSLVAGLLLLFLFPAMMFTSSAVIDLLGTSVAAYSVWFPAVYFVTRYFRRDRDPVAPEVNDAWGGRNA